jgi:hypothetical protein
MTLAVTAECLGCGCTDDEACAQGCTWLRVDYDLGLGVCSSCPEEVAHFDAIAAGDVETIPGDEPESLLLPGDVEYSQTLSYLRDRTVPR